MELASGVPALEAMRAVRANQLKLRVMGDAMEAAAACALKNGVGQFTARQTARVIEMQAGLAVGAATAGAMSVGAATAFQQAGFDPVAQLRRDRQLDQMQMRQDGLWAQLHQQERGEWRPPPKPPQGANVWIPYESRPTPQQEAEIALFEKMFGVSDDPESVLFNDLGEDRFDGVDYGDDYGVPRDRIGQIKAQMARTRQLPETKTRGLDPSDPIEWQQ